MNDGAIRQAGSISQRLLRLQLVRIPPVAGLQDDQADRNLATQLVGHGFGDRPIPA